VFDSDGLCASTPCAPTIEITGETIHFKGDITKAAAAELSRLVATGPVTRLHIRSGGGDVESALDMAVLIHDHAIDVEVEEGCFLSCANYIFPAIQHQEYLSVIGAGHGKIRHHQHTRQCGFQAATFFNTCG